MQPSHAMLAAALLLVLPSAAVLPSADATWGTPIIVPPADACGPAAFFDDFESDVIPAPGTVVYNKGSLNNWDIVAGAIDLYNPGDWEIPTAYDSQFIDMDGTSFSVGTLESKSSVSWGLGDLVTIQWLQAGNQRAAPQDTMTASLGALWSTTVVQSHLHPWNAQSHTVVAAAAGSGKLSFALAGPSDNRGILIDDVRVCVGRCDSNPLPAPILSASSPIALTVQLAWTPVSGCGPIVYTLERTLPGSSIWAPIYVGPLTTYVDLALPPCTGYQYRVRAADAASSPPAISIWSNVVATNSGLCGGPCLPSCGPVVFPERPGNAGAAVHPTCFGYAASAAQDFIVSHGRVAGVDLATASCADVSTVPPTWISLPNPPGPRSQVAATAHLDALSQAENGYWVFGGTGPGCIGGTTADICDTVEQLVDATWGFGWALRTPMPVPAAGLGAAEDGVTRLFAMGGRDCSTPACDATPLNLVQAFDTASGTWFMGAPMPTARADLAIAQRVVGGCTLIATVGGNQGRPVSGGPVLDLATVDEYNACTGVWTAGMTMPMPVAVSNAVAGWCGPTGPNPWQGPTLAVVGGTNDGQDTGLIQRWDPFTLAWSTASDPHARSHLALALDSDPALPMGSKVHLASEPGDMFANAIC